MVMETLQIRLPKKMIEELKKLVDKNHYNSKSEVIRDAIRRLLSKHSPTNNHEETKQDKKIKYDYIH
ncbi:MAG: ribbon-helix-helix protein, CopG family [Candidatus Woesearchaeota archaeon]|nr:MAG: ribbon-helix-helix protein, CopG family [Candidatus Woesearchaeota archaeon]